MTVFLKLFLTFLEIGAVSFGGGYAMIAMIRDKIKVPFSFENFRDK